MARRRPNLEAVGYGILFLITAFLYARSAGSKIGAFPDFGRPLFANLYAQRFFINLFYRAAWGVGEGSPIPFHAVNIFFHLLNGALHLAFLRRLKIGPAGIFVAVSLFLLHHAPLIAFFLTFFLVGYVTKIATFSIIGVIVARFFRPFMAVIFSLALIVWYFAVQTLWAEPSVLAERSLEVSPENRMLYQLLGEFREKKGDFEGAEVAYLKADAINQNEMNRALKAKIFLAQLYIRREKWTEARKILETPLLDRLVEGKPPIQFFRFYLFVLKKLGDNREFEKQLMRGEST